MVALIPDKMYFKIGEVASITSLRPSVLRFWESEFESLAPVKSRSGQRLYTRKELELIIEIKHLLYNEKLTIEGARKKLRSNVRHRDSANSETQSIPETAIKILNEVKEELQRIRDVL